MLKVKESVYVSVLFDGIEYPLEKSGFKSITIQSSTRTLLPTVKLVLIDSMKFFTETVPIQDGLPIVIQLGNDEENPVVYRFRVWKYPIESQSTPVYVIYGYWDAPAYFMKTTAKAKKGTARNVLAQIASEGGLSDQDLDATNDEQVWLPGNQRLCVWANQVARHAYLDGTSFFKLGITTRGKLRFKNVNRYNFTGNEPLFTHQETTTGHMVVSHRMLADSGQRNTVGGYSHSVIEQSVIQDPKVHKDTDVRKLTEVLLMNGDVKGRVDRSVVNVKPIDCGNVHDNYEKARQQNFRNSLVYAMGVEVLITDMTDIDILDKVKYMSIVYGNIAPENYETYTSNMIVTAKAIHIEAANYFEKYQFYTTGTNKDVTEQTEQEPVLDTFGSSVKSPVTEPSTQLKKMESSLNSLNSVTATSQATVSTQTAAIQGNMTGLQSTLNTIRTAAAAPASVLAQLQTQALGYVGKIGESMGVVSGSVTGTQNSVVGPMNELLQSSRQVAAAALSVVGTVGPAAALFGGNNSKLAQQLNTKLNRMNTDLNKLSPGFDAINNLTSTTGATLNKGQSAVLGAVQQKMSPVNKAFNDASYKTGGLSSLGSSVSSSVSNMDTSLQRASTAAGKVNNQVSGAAGAKS